ncbi:Coagulation factor 5/8 type domain-containing protein [Solirubrobacter sp. CPCC 204708]|uniref:Coagulation factor 5/8 type domain-containing protein n=1 Tax=Solirubrobacter deserti TaxID=2282478 RepID=A0ABT4RD50_9ACTN|nr:Coagulation factor 5/8 type domain-containing protein [Solirubrobacter deserti]MBE2317753.1 Coagulation factor 5/8 type domain-containing protein [Solirubrobacter deserti]MDA0136470.1 Coagulation factor 5/8 type domain-containing protein [Solirubrobacter deserti]
MRRAAALAALIVCVCVAPANGATDRYAYAGGCYAVAGLAGAEQVRMQATALGRYLLYRPDGTYVTPSGISAAPADWELTDELAARIAPATGCADFPEAPLNATGTPTRGATEFGRVGGVIDGHMHWMTYEYFGGRFHCGKPWDAFGITNALPDCAAIEGPGGTTAVFQNFLNYGNPAQPHDTRGYPFLTETKANNLTREGTYWRWVQRAWLGGLRLMVMSVNENRVLCTLQPLKVTDCDEMATVRRSLDDIRALQDYVDAQAGGPGKGFFQIVTDPYAARRVINQGRMAVVLEIEVSEPFGCRGWAAPCDRTMIDRELDDLYQRGVRSALLLNKYDNPLTGVRFDEGAQGTLINVGNLVSAGSFWSAKTCTGPLRDNTIAAADPGLLTALTALTGVTLPPSPLYPKAPHCNTRGLTDLGTHAVNALMDKRMIVNPDHMSQAAVDSTLTLLEKRGYSGVISPHGWMDPGNWPRLWKLGGLAFPGHSSADEYVKQWERYRPRSTPYRFGWGYGADLGGLSTQPGPGSGLRYPFKGLDEGVTFDRQVTGQRTFDYAREGVATYGQYADWLADLKRVGGSRLAEDLWNGAEAYLEMWERADGVKPSGCAPRKQGLTRTLKLGAPWTTVLARAGQPQQRERAWSWCVNGSGNPRAADVAVFGDDGRVAVVGSTAQGRRTSGLPPVGRRVGGKVRIVVRGRAAYEVRGGRVRAVALGGKGSTRAALTAGVREVSAARASQARPRFAAGARAATAPTGETLAGSGNPVDDAALTLLCSLIGT